MIEFNKVTTFSKILALILFILVIPSWTFYLGTQYGLTKTTLMAIEDSTMPDNRSIIASVEYMCDGGKFIRAIYYGQHARASMQPGQPPVPTGSVEVSLDGAASTTLMQTISADGARYATTDGSLVFWNKGNSALIMRNNSMDLDYENCTDHPSL